MAGMEDSDVLENQNMLPATEHRNNLDLYLGLASTSFPI